MKKIKEKTGSTVWSRLNEFLARLSLPLALPCSLCWNKGSVVSPGVHRWGWGPVLEMDLATCSYSWNTIPLWLCLVSVTSRGFCQWRETHGGKAPGPRTGSHNFSFLIGYSSPPDKPSLAFAFLYVPVFPKSRCFVVLCSYQRTPMVSGFRKPQL